MTPCEGLIADHVRSNVSTANATAWLVDGFGAMHAISAKNGIGRSHDGELVVLAGSVSREHAELRRTDAGWHLRDLGSRNGTYVAGSRIQGRATLDERCVLKVGDVAFWFLNEVLHELAQPLSMATASAGGGLVRYDLGPQGVELCLVGSTETATGGALLSRTTGTAAWLERGLAPLEFQMLRLLCAKAVEEATAPSAVRGCVATKQLARDLPFQSRYANEENVRQVVRRLRGVLGELGVEAILAASPGRGYYIACAVSAAASDRP